MYSQEELEKCDEANGEFYYKQAGLTAKLYMSVHDHFLTDALLDYVENKTTVAVMGGHNMSRKSTSYGAIVTLCWRLAREGFVVATGGGPGAMEAANLGAYLFEHSESQVKDAIAIMKTTKPVKVPGIPNAVEYKDRNTARRVVEKYKALYAPSLSIPTYKYHHEPYNLFATHVCKMFNNAIREDGLIAIASGGIICTDMTTLSLE